MTRHEFQLIGERDHQARNILNPSRYSLEARRSPLSAGFSWAILISQSQPTAGTIRTKPITALARKIFSLPWHLLSNDELCSDPQLPPKQNTSFMSIKAPESPTLDVLLQILVEVDMSLRK